MDQSGLLWQSFSNLTNSFVFIHWCIAQHCSLRYQCGRTSTSRSWRTPQSTCAVTGPTQMPPPSHPFACWSRWLPPGSWLRFWSQRWRCGLARRVPWQSRSRCRYFLPWLRCSLVSSWSFFMFFYQICFNISLNSIIQHIYVLSEILYFLLQIITINSTILSFFIYYLILLYLLNKFRLIRLNNNSISNSNFFPLCITNHNTSRRTSWRRRISVIPTGTTSAAMNKEIISITYL